MVLLVAPKSKIDPTILQDGGLDKLIKQLDKECKEADRYEDLTTSRNKKQNRETLLDFITRYKTACLRCRVKGMKSSDWLNTLNIIARAELPITQLALVYKTVMDKADALDDKVKHSPDRTELSELAVAQIKSLSSMQALTAAATKPKNTFIHEENSGEAEPENVLAAKQLFQKAGYAAPAKLDKKKDKSKAGKTFSTRIKDTPHPDPNWEKNIGPGVGQYTRWGAVRRCGNCRKGITGKVSACKHDQETKARALRLGRMCTPRSPCLPCQHLPWDQPPHWRASPRAAWQ